MTVGRQTVELRRTVLQQTRRLALARLAGVAESHERPDFVIADGDRCRQIADLLGSGSTGRSRYWVRPEVPERTSPQISSGLMGWRHN